ncbi:MAG: hypothetical protein PHW09_07830 [Desulfovibrio desulfuricans]|nr:hypothetical protein [Desulfovibrio desulfuricans]
MRIFICVFDHTGRDIKTFNTARMPRKNQGMPAWPAAYVQHSISLANLGARCNLCNKIAAVRAGICLGRMGIERLGAATPELRKI